MELHYSQAALRVLSRSWGQSQLSCVLKEKDVLPCPSPSLADWNADAKTGAEAVILLHLACGIHMSQMAVPRKEARSLMAK